MRHFPLNQWLLRRTDQQAVAVFVLIGLTAMGGWAVAQGGWQHRLTEAEQAKPQTAEFQVDINKAELPELNQLPGIGDTLAQRIVEHRQNIGPFTKLDDLRRVRGIGPKIMERIRPYLLPLTKVRPEAKD